MTQTIVEKLATPEQDTTTNANWIPPAGSDYAPLIIRKAQAARLLVGTASATAQVKGKGTGTSYRVRIFPKRTAQGAAGTGLAEKAELTDTASTLAHVDVTPLKYGDRVDLSFEGEFFTNGPVVAELLNSMANGLARKFDEVVYAALIAATPGASKTLATTGVLDTGDDFAKKLMACQAAMQKLDVHPNVLIVGPDQIEALRVIKSANAMAGANIQLDASGMIVGFGGMRVINAMSIANANATTASMVQAILLDTSRAYAEAFLAEGGSFESERNIKADYTTYTTFQWYGVKVADTQGIGHVTNP